MGILLLGEGKVLHLSTTVGLGGTGASPAVLAGAGGRSWTGHADTLRLLPSLPSFPWCQGLASHSVSSTVADTRKRPYPGCPAAPSAGERGGSEPAAL